MSDEDVACTIAEVAAADLCSHFHVSRLPRMQHKQHEKSIFYYGNFDGDWFSLSLQPGVDLQLDESKTDPVVSYHGWEVYFLDGWFQGVMMDDVPVYLLMDEKQVVCRYYDGLRRAICDAQMPIDCFGSDEM